MTAHPCLFYPARILEMCASVAERLITKYEGDTRPLIFAVVAEGAWPFAKAVIEAFRRGLPHHPTHTVAIKASSYVGEVQGEVKLDMEELWKGLASHPDAHVVILDDILDSGNTARALLARTAEMGHPLTRTVFASLVVRNWDSLRALPCAHMFGTNLQSDRSVPFRLKGGFLFGFGMDIDGKFRDLKWIGVVDPRDTPKIKG